MSCLSAGIRCKTLTGLDDTAAQHIWQVATLRGAPDANFEEEDHYFANQLIEKFRTTT
jgi:hypothetical protein